jgi:hypothetical protein
MELILYVVYITHTTASVRSRIYKSIFAIVNNDN